LVVFADRSEIHTLTETQGKYTLTQKISVTNIGSGIQWLKDRGYKKVDVVKMAYTDYEYKGGLIGLYIINDSFYSIILDFPNGQHEDMEKEFGLSPDDVITMPYNKYLEKIDKSKSISI
jgi:hypothetical protein